MSKLLLALLFLPLGAPAAATCTYVLQPSSQTFAAGGGAGAIQITVASTCAWTAASTANWIAIRSGASGKGTGTVSYLVAANDTASPRSAPIAIAGQNFLVSQAAGAAPKVPRIAAGGIVNTASYAAGTLAPGSLFTIYGSLLGPDQPVAATAYPLPAALGGVSVEITQGTRKYAAWLIYVSSGQINAILPSGIAKGTAHVVVTYGTASSTPAEISVVPTSLGIFFQRSDGRDLAIAQNVDSATSYPLNSAATPARPGQIVVLWGTGLGAVKSADNVASGGGDMTAVPVMITVGGLAAGRIYAGRQPQTAAVDNIYLTIPKDAPSGCQVPVEITARGVPANTTVVAITADGSPCQ